jgi:hypothetical protein
MVTVHASLVGYLGKSHPAAVAAKEHQFLGAGSADDLAHSLTGQSVPAGTAKPGKRARDATASAPESASPSTALAEPAVADTVPESKRATTTTTGTSESSSSKKDKDKKKRAKKSKKSAK